jgi:hypothetical protein
MSTCPIHGIALQCPACVASRPRAGAGTPQRKAIATAAAKARWRGHKKRQRQNAELSDGRPGHSLRRFVGLPPKTTENLNKTGSK